MQNQVPPIDIRRASVGLFVTLSCIYLLLARGGTTSSDEGYIFGTTESLAEHGSWRINVPGISRPFSRYSLVPSIIGVPFYLAARPLADAYGVDSTSQSATGLSRREYLTAAVTLQTPFVTAATAAILFIGLCRCGCRPGSAMAATVVFAFGTMALPYSGSIYVQPLGALALTGVLFCAALDYNIGLALALVLLLLIRLEMLAVLPVLLFHAAKSRSTAARSLGWLAVGAVVGFSLQVLVNILRNDHWLKGDYGAEAFSTPVGLGLWSVLFSSGKGLLWFAPAAAIGLVLLPFFAVARPRIGMLALGFAITNFIMVACWWTWHGGWSWGPRLLVPIMPVLTLPLAWLFQRWGEQTAGIRWAVIAVIILSVVVQLCGVLHDPLSDRTAMLILTGGNENESIYIPQVGPWGAEADSSVRILFTHLWDRLPDCHFALVMASAGLLMIALGTGAWTMRQLGIGLHDMRGMVPRLRSDHLLGVSICLVCLSGPTVAEWLLLARGGNQNERAVNLPIRFQSFQLNSSTNRWTGTVYAPLGGDYFFYEQSPNVTQCYLDGRAIFSTLSGPMLIALRKEMSAGYHRLEFDNEQSGRPISIYWTTPGNAHYKEPIPRLYLAGPVVAREQQWAIGLAHWKWIVWTLGIVACLFTFGRTFQNATDSQ